MSRAFGITIMLINITAISSQVISEFPSLFTTEGLNNFTILVNILELLVFAVNTITLGYYLRMGLYFIDMLQDDPGKKKRFKIIMWLILCMIILSNCVENCVYPLVNLLRRWKIV